ncbi:MAG TPA: ATP-binding protein, partial [Bacteroidota bacterium]|nr:ATP-binding protein [Bacteroidota bacterium]
RFQHWGTHEGLRDERVYSFVEGPDGSRWFGTLSGISRWKAERWTYWPENNKDRFTSFTIALDGSGNLWISDRSGSIGKLDPSYKFTAVTTGDGLPDASVWDIRADSAGTIWIGTEKGVAAFIGGRWISIDASSGLANSRVWPVLPLGDRVYIGTFGDGVIELKPSECIQPPAKILLNAAITEGGETLVRWSAFSYGGEPSPDHVVTRVRLNQGPWSGWSDSHEVTYGSLSAGSYFFQIQAKNLFGVVDSAGKFGTFIIAPPFYLRSSFLAPIGTLIIGLFALVVAYVVNIRARDRDLLASEAQLRIQGDRLNALALELSSAEERERRQIATYLHDHISSALAFCKMELSALKGEIKQEDVKRITHQIDDIYDLAQSLTFELSPPILHELGLEAAIGSLAEQMQVKHGIQITVSHSHKRIAFDERISLLLFHSVRELLINIVKHAHASKAGVDIIESQKTITITVSDDGEGISIPKDPHAESRKGGFGIFNIRQRMSSLGGSLTVQSARHSGTTIVLTLPIPDPAHSIE